MAGTREHWFVYAEMGKKEDGSPALFTYGISSRPMRKPPRKAPAGGTIELSSDGKWLTVYRPAREGEPQDTRLHPSGMIPVQIFVKLNLVGKPTG